MKDVFVERSARQAAIGRDKPHIARAQPYDHEDGWVCYGGPIPEFNRSDEATPEEMFRAMHGGVGVGGTPAAAWNHWCACNFGD